MGNVAADFLEPYRPYLEVLARAHLPVRLRSKADPADLVQQAMMQAYAAVEALDDRAPAVLTAWLRKILANTLVETIRHFDAAKRDAARERSIEADLD